MAYFGIALCFIPLIAGIFVMKFACGLKLKYQLWGILAGLIAVFPIAAIEFFIPDFPFLKDNPILYSLLRSILLYGLVEEILKMCCLIPLPHRKLSTFQFLLLSFITALALACFESSVYYFECLQSAHEKLGAKILYGQILLRIISSDVIHVTCTGLCGMFIISCRNKAVRPGILITAILLHGFYDFFAGFRSNLKWFAIPVILLAIVECKLKYTAVTSDD